MSYNKENLARVRETYATKHLEAEKRADALKLKLYGEIPGLRELDRRLAATGPRIMAVAMKQSDETIDAIHEDNAAMQKERASLLRAYGYPADYTDPRYECMKCRDSGMDGNRMCECMRRELIMAGYESSGIARMMRTQTFENFDLNYYRTSQKTYDNMKRVYQTIYDYARSFDPASSPSLSLFGGTGLGKTHLSTALAKTVIDAGWDVVYTDVIGMLSDLEIERFGNSSGFESGNSRDRYFACDLLIIDDVGTEISNQFTAGCLYDIINIRINRRVPTVLSTNLGPEEFNERYSDRITSRVFGEYLPLMFTGSDVRRQKLMQNN